MRHRQAFVLPDQTGPRGPFSAGGGCSGDIGTPRWDTFGGSGVSAGNEEATLFAYRTGDATRVVLNAGTARRQLEVADGWTVGRINGPPVSAVLIGYDDSGAEIGRLELPVPER